MEAPNQKVVATQLHMLYKSCTKVKAKMTNLT